MHELASPVALEIACPPPSAQDALLKNLPLPVWVYSPDANAFRWANHAALELWRTSSQEAFRAIDLSDMRDSTRARLERTVRRLRRESQITEVWTLYPRGHSVTAPCTLWLLDWEGERCLACMLLPQLECDTIAELRRRDAILGATVRSAERLLHGSPWARERDMLLREIGRAAEADRCYFFAFDGTAGSTWIARQDFEWCAPAVAPQIGISELQHLDMAAAGFSRWLERFDQGKPVIIDDIADAPAAERAFILPLGIRAMCQHPVMAEGAPLGFIGLDIDEAHRGGAFSGWSPVVLEGLATAAHLIAAAYQMGQSRVRLADALTRVQDLSAAKSAFLANMSHELRTPLNAVIGFAEMIDSEILGPVQPPQYRGYAADIAASGRHLLSLVNDVLDLEKALSGQMPVEENEADLDRDVVAPAVRILGELAAKAGVTLEVTHECSAIRLRADTRKLMQAVLNLADNAVKFSDPGSAVTIRTRNADGGAVIEVEDRAGGMTPKEVEQALQPFTQVGKRRFCHGEGTGLGLPLAAQFTELHGGRLEIDSKKGAGTTARIHLPARRVLGGAPSDRALSAAD